MLNILIILSCSACLFTAIEFSPFLSSHLVVLGWVFCLNLLNLLIESSSLNPDKLVMAHPGTNFREGVELKFKQGLKSP